MLMARDRQGHGLPILCRARTRVARIAGAGRHQSARCARRPDRRVARRGPYAGGLTGTSKFELRRSSFDRQPQRRPAQNGSQPAGPTGRGVDEVEFDLLSGRDAEVDPFPEQRVVHAQRMSPGRNGNGFCLAERQDYACAVVHSSKNLSLPAITGIATAKRYARRRLVLAHCLILACRRERSCGGRFCHWVIWSPGHRVMS